MREEPIWRPLLAGVLLVAPVLLGNTEGYIATWKMIVSLSASGLALVPLVNGAFRAGSVNIRIMYIYCGAATAANALGLMYMRFWSPITDIGGAGLSLLALWWATAACFVLLVAAARLSHGQQSTARQQ